MMSADCCSAENQDSKFVKENRVVSINEFVLPDSGGLKPAALSGGLLVDRGLMFQFPQSSLSLSSGNSPSHVDLGFSLRLDK